jgi:hypothetical protein
VTNLPLIVQLAIGAAQILFLAGGFYVFIKQLRKDLNGVGTKLRALDERSDDRQLVATVAILLLTPADKQLEIAQLLIAAGKGKNR